MSELKQLFKDLSKELNGEILEDVFEVGGITFKMRLLNAQERTWAYSHITGTASGVGTALQVQIPMLAIGVREINGQSVFSYFKEEFEALPTEVQKDVLDTKNGPLFYGAGLLYEMLENEAPELGDALSEKWRELELRKKAAGEEIKK